MRHGTSEWLSTVSQMNNKPDEFIFCSLSVEVTADSSIKLTSTVFGLPNALYQVIRQLFPILSTSALGIT